MVTALLMIGSRSAGAQSEQVQKAPPSIEELKKRLLQLEQAVQELKGQINATEQSPKASNALFIPSAGGAAVEAASSKSKSTLAPQPTPICQMQILRMRTLGTAP